MLWVFKDVAWIPVVFSLASGEKHKQQSSELQASQRPLAKAVKSFEQPIQSH